MAAFTVFDNVVLTATYAGNQVVVDTAASGFALLIDYTNGDETSLQVQVEVSDDNVTWFLPADGTGSSLAEVLTTTTTGQYRIHVSDIIGLFQAGERYCRVSVKATGGTPDGTVLVRAARVPTYPVPATRAV
jgi:hypothetical protein